MLFEALRCWLKTRCSQKVPGTKTGVLTIGHTSFCVELGDLDLDGLNENDFVSVFQLTSDRLRDLGYVVSEKSWDVSGFLIGIT